MSELENNGTNVVEEILQGPDLDPALVEEMAKAGVLYGRKKSKTHPRMKPYIFATRNSVEILDLPKTHEALDKAGDFIKEVAKKDGLVLVVGTKPAAQDLVENFGKKFSMPHVSKRWLGGTLTNFKTILKRTQFYQNLKAQEATGKLDKYTKKEQLGFHKLIEKMDVFFSGLEKLTRVPDVVLVVNANDHIIAVREAKLLKIPVVAILNTDTDPGIVEYPIPANDNAQSSLAWIFQRLESKMAEGLKEKTAVPVIAK